MVTTTSVKDQIRRLAEWLPDDATWDDVLYQIEFRRRFERGLKDSEEGRTVPHDEVGRLLGLDRPCG